VDARLRALQLTPGKAAILVRIERQQQVEIAQRNIPPQPERPVC
jgi:hypothetical protein